jgi:hypothetical protein
MPFKKGNKLLTVMQPPEPRPRLTSTGPKSDDTVQQADDPSALRYRSPNGLEDYPGVDP